MPADDRGSPREAEELRSMLRRIDGEPWGRYRQLIGRYALGEFELAIDRVPPDPFAGPARLRISATKAVSGLQQELIASRARRIGAEDHLAWEVEEALRKQTVRSRVRVEAGGPAVIERGACRLGEKGVSLRLLVDLPAWGRRVRGQQAEALIFEDLRRLATSTLLFSKRRMESARSAANNAEDHEALQAALADQGRVAFVADGSRLARAGGDDTGPRRDGREVPFQSPPELRVTLDTPHSGPITGMGVPAGVTLIVGGGFHGKSTLLDALARGVYPHRSGDGRERVATVAGAVVARAEDGRSVRGVDISAFLGDLPSGVRAEDFSTEKASGSTSQASSIVEALEVGARLLLLDEDRCATNFMVRDGRMQRLVPRPAEPIVPFIDRVRELYDTFGVSTVLVTGGSGDYLDVADTVIQMRDYEPRDVTARAREIAEETRTMRLDEKPAPMAPPARRIPHPGAGAPAERIRSGTRGPRAVRLDDETVDLRALEQIAERGQVRALVPLMKRASRRMESGMGLAELVNEIDGWLDRVGIDSLDSPVAYDLARPRPYELAAALNRWRRLRFSR